MAELHARGELASLSTVDKIEARHLGDASTRWGLLDESRCIQRTTAAARAAANFLPAVQVTPRLRPSSIAQTAKKETRTPHMAYLFGSLERRPVLDRTGSSELCDSIPRFAPTASVTHTAKKSTSDDHPRLTFTCAAREQAGLNSIGQMNTFGIDNSEKPSDTYRTAYG
jgi:hypothetical protein